ncbi:MAG: hypothetical protein NVSMB26_23390 [Beijerinckiaceae bacterium]
MLRALVLTLVVACLATSAAAQAPRGRDQGDWPCRQIKVPTIALGSIWTGPAIDASSDEWRNDPELAALVARVSERRTSLDDAQAAIADYAKSLGPDKRGKLSLLMAGIFDRMNNERADVIAGLERYGRKQKDMATRVKTEIESLNNAQSDGNASPDKTAELAERVQWDTRVFEDRRRSLTYVCETPVLIEQRLGALARTIEAAME